MPWFPAVGPNGAVGEEPASCVRDERVPTAVGDAIAITVTAVLLTGGALALARDWGGHNSRLAADVAARNRRAPFKWFLLTKSARTFNTDANRVKVMNTRMAYFSAGLGIVMLVVEFVAILSKGIR